MIKKPTYEALEQENRELKNSLRDMNQAREELIKNRKMFKAVVEGLSDPMIVVDRDLKLKWINNAALNYYGVSPGKSIEGICCYQALRGRSRPCAGCRIPGAVPESGHICFERDGFMVPERRELVTICPVGDHGSPNYYVSIRIEDITDSQKVETELIHADKMISLGVLLSGMAHEINNPNNAILLNAQLLSKSWKSIHPILDAYFQKNGEFNVGGLPYSEMRQEIPDILRGVESSSKRIKHLIRDLKGFASTNNPLETQSVNINAVITDSIRLTGKLIRDKTHHFHIDLDETLPEIKANGQGIEQVMINLVENACQAIEKKDQGLWVTSLLAGDKNSIIIEVRDQGKGIQENIEGRVMEPFFTTRRSEGGIGLGLSTSLTIVRNHGGTIKLSSKAGEGTSVKIVLPVVPAKQAAKILIADDDPASRKTLIRILERSGRFSLTQSGSGAQTLLMLGQDPPDLLILDVHMPDIGGYEVCRAIKDRPELSAVDILVVTGLINAKATQKIRTMGYDNILEKPVDRQELVKLIYAMLEDKL